MFPVPPLTVVSPTCETVTCAINHLSEVVQDSLQHDGFDWWTLASQIAIGVFTLLIAILSLRLSRRIAEEDKRFRERERRDQKRYRKEQERRQRKEFGAIVREIVDARPDGGDPGKAGLRQQLLHVAKYSGEKDSLGLLELIDDISRLHETRLAANASGRRIPAEWTRSTIEGIIANWTESPKRYLKSLHERLELDAYMRDN
jgi:hypothetical protein